MLQPVSLSILPFPIFNKDVQCDITAQRGARVPVYSHTEHVSQMERTVANANLTQISSNRPVNDRQGELH